MTLEEGAALTITYQTAWFALHRRAVIEAGDWVLVHSGAGGVGSAIIQVAKAAAARVIATAGGAEKVAVCKKLGADIVVDYTKEDFVDAVKRATEGRGANIIVDPVGGDVFDRSTRCIAFEGRIVVVGFTSGRIPELKMNYPLVKNYSVLGLHWGLYRQYDPRAIEWAQKELYRLYADGAVKPLISQVLPMNEAPKAMASVASRGSTGKVVLKP
jgi:NADPH2:quinone reductase